MSRYLSHCLLCGVEVPVLNNNVNLEIVDKDKAECASIVSSLLFSEENFDVFRDLLKGCVFCEGCYKRVKILRVQLQAVETVRNRMALTLVGVVESVSGHYNELRRNQVGCEPLLETLDFMLEDMGMQDGFDAEECYAKIGSGLLNKLNERLDYGKYDFGFDEEDEEVENTVQVVELLEEDNAQVSSTTNTGEDCNILPIQPETAAVAASAVTQTQAKPNNPKEDTVSKIINQFKMKIHNQNYEEEYEERIKKRNRKESKVGSTGEVKVVNICDDDEEYSSSVSSNEEEYIPIQVEKIITEVPKPEPDDKPSSDVDKPGGVREKRMFPCKKCMVVCTSKVALDGHYQTVHGAEDISLRFKCSYCPKAYRLRCFLAKHIFNVHPNEKPLPGNYKKFQCEICLKFKYNAKDLAQHIRAQHRKREACYSTTKPKTTQDDRKRGRVSSKNSSSGSTDDKKSKSSEKQLPEERRRNETTRQVKTRSDVNGPSDAKESGSGSLSWKWKCRICEATFDTYFQRRSHHRRMHSDVDAPLSSNPSDGKKKTD